jgi:hypothetical protein
MANALKTVGWIESAEGSPHIVSPWGKVGEDGYVDYRALLTDNDIQALAKTGVTVEEFVAGLRAVNPHGGLAPVAGTEGSLYYPVGGPHSTDYGANVARQISQQ